MLTTTVREETEAFLKAWDDYLVEIKTAFLAVIPSNKKELISCMSKKFNSLKEVDKHFHSYIKPVVGRFFKRNPSIHRNHGEAEDIEIYSKYADHCPYLLKPCLIGMQCPVPPRIYIHCPIESVKDVLLLGEKNSTIYKKRAEFMEEVINHWKNYQDLILALAERDEAMGGG